METYRLIAIDAKLRKPEWLPMSSRSNHLATVEITLEDGQTVCVTIPALTLASILRKASHLEPSRIDEFDALIQGKPHHGILKGVEISDSGLQELFLAANQRNAWQYVDVVRR